MSRAKNKLGPWKMTVQENGYVCVETDFGHCRNIIAGEFATLSPNVAQVIAAAPDMYEALEGLLELMEEEGLSHPYVDDALAALKKADGEEAE